MVSHDLWNIRAQHLTGPFVQPTVVFYSTEDIQQHVAFKLNRTLVRQAGSLSIQHKMKKGSGLYPSTAAAGLICAETSRCGAHLPSRWLIWGHQQGIRLAAQCGYAKFGYKICLPHIGWPLRLAWISKANQRTLECCSRLFNTALLTLTTSLPHVVILLTTINIIIAE